MRPEISALLSPQLGLISAYGEAAAASIFSPDCHVISARTGFLRSLHPELRLWMNQPSIVGSGSSQSRQIALRNAVLETAERYAAAVYDLREPICASEKRLGASALRVSQGTPLSLYGEPGGWKQITPAPEAEMRWMASMDLLSEDLLYVPLVMTHLYVEPLSNERFVSQSSAGTAAHFDLRAALSSALLELVERETVEAIWRLRPSLPELDVSTITTWCDTDGEGAIWQRFYDATSDLGVPTVYGVRLVRPPIGHDIIVSAASSFNLMEAVKKAYADAIGQQLVRQHESGGAAYSRFLDRPGAIVSDSLPTAPDMGFLGRARAKPRTKPIIADFEALLMSLGDRRYRVLGLDLTTNDLREIGVRVARVVVPELLPYTPSPKEAYLDHPRLTELARFWGTSSASEVRRATEPQPFL